MIAFKLIEFEAIVAGDQVRPLNTVGDYIPVTTVANQRHMVVLTLNDGSLLQGNRWDYVEVRVGPGTRWHQEGYGRAIASTGIG